MEQMLGSFIGKLLRDNFGKGPESVYVTIKNKYIVIYLRKFISPIENLLLEENQYSTVDKLRIKLFNLLIPQITQYIETIAQNKIKEFYCDWSLDNKSGMFVCIAENSFNNVEQLEDNFYNKNKLEEEMIKLSHYAQRAPDELYSFELNPKTLLVIRNGIMIRLEKELIRRGNEDILRAVKKEMEKTYLHNNVDLEVILNKTIVDSFTAWDFYLDKSVFLFILNPDKPISKPPVEMS